MIDPYIKYEIQREIRKQLEIILPALTKSTTATTENIDQLYSGMPPIENRPIMHPYGLCSRAPTGTRSVVARMGEHASNRFTIGHFDIKRTEIAPGDGETVVYNEHGQQIRLENGKIIHGATAEEQAVLGNTLVTALGILFDTLINGNHVIVTTAGNPTAPNPAVTAQLALDKTKYLSTAATNILSTESYLERNAP